MKINDKNKERNKYRLASWVIAFVLAIAMSLWLSASIFAGSDWARDYLMQKLTSAIGRPLHAEKLTLQLTRNLRIDATQLSISNPDWTRSGPDFLRAESASFNIALLPLLIGQIRIDNAELMGAQLFLERNANNANNWHFQTISSAAGVPDQSNAKRPSITFLPNRLLIRQATVQYRAADGKTRRWQLPALVLNASAGRKVQTDIQILADNRNVHLTMRADNLADFGANARTPFMFHAEIPGQIAAGIIHAEGVIGLSASLAGTDLRMHIDAPAKSPWQTLMGIGQRDLAAIKLDAALRERDGSMEIAQLAFALGDLHVSGQGMVHMKQSPLRIEGQLRTDYLDWKQMTLDAGLPQPPPKRPGALFRDVPLAWPLLSRVNGFTANVDLQLSVLKLRSGLPLQNVKARVELQADQMRVPVFSANFMGGVTSADALFIAHDQQIKLNLKASGVSIEQWRDALHKSRLFTGAPLAVNANVSANGASMNQLAATLTGAVSLRMGRAVVLSSRASEIESILTGLVPALAGKQVDRMEVVCAAASLPFENGRATGISIAGVRTESSQLLADGVIDLRDQTLDLHGRVKGINGIQLGASMLVGAVNISGKLVKPRFRLDGRGVAGTAARVGAAVLSFGLTAVVQALWDANADDACKVAEQRSQNKQVLNSERAVSP